MDGSDKDAAVLVKRHAFDALVVHASAADGGIVNCIYMEDILVPIKETLRKSGYPHSVIAVNVYLGYVGVMVDFFPIDHFQIGQCLYLSIPGIDQ